MRTPFQMFGQSANPAMRAVAQARQAVSRAGSPEAALQQLMASNPQFAQMVGNQTPEQAVRSLAPQLGVNVDGLIGMLGNR